MAPAMVMDVPTVPEYGVKLEMLGGTTIVKFTALLAKLPTVTITFPVVAPAGTGTAILVAVQLVGVAAAPLNATVLLPPCVAPKPDPVIVTEVPTPPKLGDRPVT